MNTYSDTTGLLIFEGPPQPNARLQAWLAGIVRQGDSPSSQGFPVLASDSAGVSKFLQEWAGRWRCVNLTYEAESDYCELGGDQFMAAACLALKEKGFEASMDDSPEELLRLLGEAYDQVDYVESLALDEGDEIDVATQVQLAMRFSGENNLRAAMIQTGYHSDRIVLWGFGGYNELVLRHDDGAIEAIDFTPRHDMIEAFGRFHERPSSAERSHDATPSGGKTAYVECFSPNQYVSTPVFATFVVSPAMLETLRHRQALASEHGLDEIHFSSPAGFEFCTDDPSGGMDAGATERWVVNKDGDAWIEALTETNDRILSRSISIDDLGRELKSASPVIAIQGTSASGGEFLLAVAQKMNEQMSSGEYDWSAEIPTVVETLCQIDPQASEDYRELLPVARLPAHRSPS